MAESEEKLRQRIRERIGDFDNVNCCVTPTKVCPSPDKCGLYYESAGALIVRADRSNRSLEDESKKWGNEAKKVLSSSMKRATLRANLVGRGIDINSCFNEPKQ